MRKPLDTTQRQRLLELAGSQRDLTEELGVDRASLEAWQRTGRGLKRQTVRLLEYLADTEERLVALEQAGLPTCDWAESFVFPEGGDVDATIRAQRELQAHGQQCSTCLQRQRFLEQRFGRPKQPLGPLMRVMAGVAALIMRMPAVLRPAAVGALLLCGLVAGRALFSLPFLLGSPEFVPLLRAMPLALVGAAGAGASGGLTYSITKPLAALFGAASDYVSGVASVAGYFAGMVALGPYAFGEEAFPVETSGDIWILVVMSVVFGLAAGHGLRSSKN